MTAATFDTHPAAKALRTAAFNEVQVEAADVVVRDTVTDGITDKTDTDRIGGPVTGLEGRIETVRRVARRSEYHRPLYARRRAPSP